MKQQTIRKEYAHSARKNPETFENRGDCPGNVLQLGGALNEL